MLPTLSTNFDLPSAPQIFSANAFNPSASPPPAFFSAPGPQPVFVLPSPSVLAVAEPIALISSSAPSVSPTMMSQTAPASISLISALLSGIVCSLRSIRASRRISCRNLRAPIFFGRFVTRDCESSSFMMFLISFLVIFIINFSFIS